MGRTQSKWMKSTQKRDGYRTQKCPVCYRQKNHEKDPGKTYGKDTVKTWDEHRKAYGKDTVKKWDEHRKVYGKDTVKTWE